MCVCKFSKKLEKKSTASCEHVNVKKVSNTCEQIASTHPGAPADPSTRHFEGYSKCRVQGYPLDGLWAAEGCS